MRKTALLLLLLLCMSAIVGAQTFDQMGMDGNMNQRDGRNGNFNPHNNDTTRGKEVPKGIYVWTVDRHFGDITRAEVDTMPHLYPQSTMATGRYGQYNTTGSNFTPRLSRIFTDRPATSQFLFTDGYDQLLRQPDQWHFTNTLSPITNLTYGSCGDKTNGEDVIDARFAVNANKRTGMGFDLDYRYARGYFQNQNNSHFGSTFYVSHLGDRYQLHLLFQAWHQKASENGGITNDNYITHPELFTDSYSESEIPTVLQSNWNRNNHQHLFLTHRYSVGFYRQVPMTPEEIEARKFAEQSARDNRPANDDRDDRPAPAGRPDDARIMQAPDSLMAPALTDSLALADDSAGRITVDSKEMADSLIQAERAAAADTAYMKREFVPVTSFIHTADISKHNRIYQAYYTPNNYYADTYLASRPGGTYTGDSIYDQTRFLTLRNTFAIALLEGFNKYAPAGLKAFASHELRRIDMPDVPSEQPDSTYRHRWTEHSVSIGGQLTKTQGSLLHYDVLAEAWLAGEDAGQLKLDARGDLNIPLLGDTVRLDARAWLHRLNPTFLQRHYHGKHFWWDNDLGKETRTHLEAALSYTKTNTRLRVALDEIENYTYLGMDYAVKNNQPTALTAAFQQHDASLTVVTAQLEQRLRLGPLHWENVLTFQTTSNEDVLPLPTFNVFTNLYFEFMVAHVLRVELGASGTWFTKYNAPDYVPGLGLYAVQQNDDSRMELGNFPFVDAYANLHLKHARFFIMMSNALGKNFDRMAFLTPHYPLNRSVLHMGVSWNFWN